jgi:hypothetical protein
MMMASVPLSGLRTNLLDCQGLTTNEIKTGMLPGRKTLRNPALPILTFSFQEHETKVKRLDLKGKDSFLKKTNHDARCLT